MTLDEYTAQKTDLEGQLAALEAEWVASQEYPKWVYHEHEAAQIVESPAQLEALGAGWTETPPGTEAPAGEAVTEEASGRARKRSRS